MPPMVLFKAAGSSWQPDEAHLEYYARRARAGTGLIVVEATAISPEGRLAPFQLRAWDDSHVPALAAVAKAIKTHGAIGLVQIHHAGANTKPAYIDGAEPVSPSGLRVSAGQGGSLRALACEEIHALIASYAAAAQRCVHAGFDGVELHGAHGYLLGQFLSPLCNRRSDAFGGPALEGRLAFPLAVVEAVRAALGPQPLLGYRLGAAEYLPGGLTLEEGLAAARRLAGTGCLDLLHVSTGLGGGEPPSLPEGFGFGPRIWLGAQVKGAVSLPVIAVGGIRFGGEARKALELRIADMIAVGRAMLADPDWSAKALSGNDRDIVACQACRRCAYFTVGRRCKALSARV